MNCPTCGATLTDGTTTCPTCGASISQPADFNQMQYQQPQANYNQQPYQQPQANFNQAQYQQPQANYNQAQYQQPQSDAICKFCWRRIQAEIQCRTFCSDGWKPPLPDLRLPSVPDGFPFWIQ